MSNTVHRRRTVSATFFVVVGFGASQLVRLVGNIVLTRLLVPEYFGVIALASVYVTGLALFSDIGLAPAVIRSNRSSDPVFLNTAWTLQLLRGPAIWLVAAALAFPIASLYDEPVLRIMIPLIGLTPILQGFQSTSLILLQRDLKQGSVTLIELIAQIAGLGCTIAVAYIYRSVWALAIGGLVTTVLKTVWSHFLNRENPNRFRLERESVRELLGFGKWILLSTAMMFLATQADRLLLGKLFDMTLFGVYGIAVTFAEMPKKVISHVSNRVIFPAISKIADLPRRELRAKIARTVSIRSGSPDCSAVQLRRPDHASSLRRSICRDRMDSPASCTRYVAARSLCNGRP
jgi:O-antigen/teichoic acid export membrane protein